MKSHFKQTEIGLIPNDWRVQDLSSFSVISAGGTPNRSVGKYWNGDVPWITTSQINFNTITTAYDFITVSGLKNSAAKILPPGTLLMALYGQGKTRGKIGILGIAATTNQACASIIVASQVSRAYAFHVLASRYKSIRNLSNSGSQENLNGRIVKSIQIPLPPTKAEQEAIAGALSDADALIESLEQLLAKKRHLKQGVMQGLLTGKKRLPGFSGEWAVKRLGVLADIQRGASPRPIDSPLWFDENSLVGWVRISDVTKSGLYLLETTQRLSTLGIRHSRPVKRGSLIMSICATVGRPIITMIETCIHDGFVVFDNIRGTTRNFLFYILTSIEDVWSRHGQTGSQMNLNTGLINRTEVAMPPTMEEQDAIGAILSDMDADLTILEAKLTKARALKQGMMQELLTGRIRLV